MSSLIKRIGRRMLMVAFLGCLLLAGIHYLAQLKRFDRQLGGVCATADRVVVDYDTIGGPKHGGRQRPPNPVPLPVFEVTGQDRVTVLRESFKLRSELAGLIHPTHCKCYGEVVFRFYRGNIQLAAVSYHHRDHLRWVDNESRGDLPLTPEGCAAIEAWIVQHTKHSLAEMVEETSRRLSEGEESAEQQQAAESRPSMTQPA